MLHQIAVLLTGFQQKEERYFKKRKKKKGVLIILWGHIVFVGFYLSHLNATLCPVPLCGLGLVHLHIYVSRFSVWLFPLERNGITKHETRMKTKWMFRMQINIGSEHYCFSYIVYRAHSETTMFQCSTAAWLFNLGVIFC